ncbi:MAG: hypothetical protein SGJ15_02035 [Bacteroidota bacterium]|nr:hypothetical protein [Bacteroidota bacterium]
MKKKLMLILVMVSQIGVAQKLDVLLDLISKELVIDSIKADNENIKITYKLFVSFGKSKTKKNSSGKKVKTGNLSLLGLDQTKEFYSNVKWIKYTYSNDTEANLSFYWPDDHKANNLGKLKPYLFELFMSKLTSYSNENGKVTFSTNTERYKDLRVYFHYK